MWQTVRDGLETGTLVLVPGILAWLSGFPFIFPSLGPTAYVLATAPKARTNSPHRVVGGHAIGVAAGLFAFGLVGPPVAVTGPLAPGSDAAFALAASGVLATALTALAMLATDLVHPPACATTLIVGLGLLSTRAQALGIVVAVLVLVVVHRLGRWLGLFVGQTEDETDAGHPAGAISGGR